MWLVCWDDGRTSQFWWPGGIPDTACHIAFSVRTDIVHGVETYSTRSLTLFVSFYDEKRVWCGSQAAGLVGNMTGPGPVFTIRNEGSKFSGLWRSWRFL